jgi:hypothetical protein
MEYVISVVINRLHLVRLQKRYLGKVVVHPCPAGCIHTSSLSSLLMRLPHASSHTLVAARILHMGFISLVAHKVFINLLHTINGFHGK